jgi:hypothetical protein
MVRWRIRQLAGLILMGIGVWLVVTTWPHSIAEPPASSVIAAVTAALETPTPVASHTPTAIAATSTPTPSDMPTHTLTLTTTLTCTPSPQATARRAPLSTTGPLIPRALTSPASAVKSPVWEGRARFGVSGAISPYAVEQLGYAVEQLGVGWYMNWQVSASPARPGGVEFAQTIRTPQGVLSPNVDAIAAVARAAPGSLWLVGNEPDQIALQDDATPIQYAAAYHQAYEALKRADPTALVAAGGIVQPTPLRLRYLDAVLAAYQQLYGAPMPVDVWQIHNYVLREERGSWGAEIPPGLPDNQGMLYEVDDSGNLEVWKAHIWAFRRWMQDRGYRDKPLVVSEYGIPMPPDYGFEPDRVRGFMRDTLDFFLSATDPALGYPPDANRLVQRWCWFSVADLVYPTGNLFDPQTRQITPLGQAWREYVGAH